jgi:hypothetical protein
MSGENAVLNVRIPKSLADRLEARKKRWSVPTSAFVRFCIEDWLRIEDRADAKGLYSDSPNTIHPPVRVEDVDTSHTQCALPARFQPTEHPAARLVQPVLITKVGN